MDPMERALMMKEDAMLDLCIEDALATLKQQREVAKAMRIKRRELEREIEETLEKIKRVENEDKAIKGRIQALEDETVDIAAQTRDVLEEMVQTNRELMDAENSCGVNELHIGFTQADTERLKEAHVGIKKKLQKLSAEHAAGVEAFDRESEYQHKLRQDREEQKRERLSLLQAVCEEKIRAEHLAADRKRLQQSILSVEEDDKSVLRQLQDVQRRKQANERTVADALAKMKQLEDASRNNYGLQDQDPFRRFASLFLSAQPPWSSNDDFVGHDHSVDSVGHDADDGSSPQRPRTPQQGISHPVAQVDGSPELSSDQVATHDDSEGPAPSDAEGELARA